MLQRKVCSSTSALLGVQHPQQHCTTMNARTHPRTPRTHARAVGYSRWGSYHKSICRQSVYYRYASLHTFYVFLCSPECPRLSNPNPKSYSIVVSSSAQGDSKFAEGGEPSCRTSTQICSSGRAISNELRFEEAMWASLLIGRP